MSCSDTAPVIEVLYPEFGNQAGDNGNEMYLRACLPDATFVHTSYGDTPYLADKVPSLVLMCGMTELQQDIAARGLAPYRDRLAELIDAGVPMLFTGSAAEVLGTSITNPDGTSVEGLGILDFVTHRNMPKRYLDVVVGTFVPAPGEKPIEVVGFKIQFTLMEGRNESSFFLSDEVGFGLNERSRLEGFRRNNLIATWLIGPLLPSNPDLVRWILDVMGETDVTLAFEGEARRAHDERARTFRLPGMHLDI
jgi:Predicted glutamine amidotransferase